MTVAFSSDIRRITVPVGAREYIAFVGNVFTVLAANVGVDTDPDFRIGINDSSPNRFKKGLRFAMPIGEYFQQLAVENTSLAGPLIIEIMLAQGDVSDERAQLAGSVNAAIVSMPAVTIAGTPAVTATISGTPAVTATITGTPAVTATISGTPAVTATITGTPDVRITAPPTGASVVTESAFACDTVQRICLNANPLRVAATLMNMGPGTVRVGMAVSSTSGIRLRPGQALTICASGEIRCIAVSGTASLMRQWVSL